MCDKESIAGNTYIVKEYEQTVNYKSQIYLWVVYFIILHHSRLHVDLKGVQI